MPDQEAPECLLTDGAERCSADRGYALCRAG